MRNKLTGQFVIFTTALAGLLSISMLSPAIASSECENFRGCEKKFCEIERQLTISLEEGNERKANGLRDALKNAKDHCTDAGLKEDLLEEINEAEAEIDEYESDLKEAEEDGKADKVRKYQEKIEEERNKIKRLEHELSALD